MIVDAGLLPIGADLILPVPPQVIHRVEMGRALRQPDQLHAEAGGQPPGGSRDVTAILIEQDGHLPASIMVMDQVQERLEVFGPLVLSRQEQPMARAQIHRPEDHTAGIPATQEDLLGPSPQRPTRPQRREQQQIRFILGQQNASGAQAPDLTADPPFFFSNSGSGSRT